MHDTAPYVVSEPLEGQNLRERIAGTALSIHKALDYAAQLAGGLAAAHAKGITHRDLKREHLRDGRRARQDPLPISPASKKRRRSHRMDGPWRSRRMSKTVDKSGSGRSPVALRCN
jgi:serine/threonine protein kinase